jgi:LacI family transcriptional regulator
VITIKDIAKTVGVSITTVSRALNGYDDVSEFTRKKIQEAAKQLGYRPNASARSLVMKKSKTIGLIISEVSRSGIKDSFAYEVLCGINDRSGVLDYDLILFSTNPVKQKSKSYTDLCLERGVDGAIIMGFRLNDPYLHEVINSKVPCVLIDIPIKADNVGYISTDNIHGSWLATSYLIEQGHQEIAMINGHPYAAVSIDRLKGYQKALTDHHLKFTPERVVSGDFTENGGEQAVLELFHKDNGITAIFCASDLMALGALKGLEQLGKRVPEDVSIVGYDNIHLSQYTNPPMTTMNQDKYEMGCHAAQLLIDMLEGNATAREIILPTQLIHRNSVLKIIK